MLLIERIRKNPWPYILSVLTVALFLAFIYKSLTSMINIPFNEFDEAHRAENAKRMKQYNSFFVPLTGSPHDRIIDYRIPSEEHDFKFLYFHLERPPLIYDLMVLSTLLFGSTEFAYRLPSFVLGMISILALIYFAKKISNKFNVYTFFLALICLLTSSDLWLSSQYAQLDTGITTFLFISLLSLILYLEDKKKLLIFISAACFGLAILSKGQPAILLVPPLVFLVATKKLSFKELMLYILFTSIILLPWVVYASMKFGLVPFLKTFTDFAFTTNAQDVVHHKAPIFWYVRWWWETFRPGWAIFITFLAIDILKRNFDWKKLTLLTFILVNFFWLSLPDNKLWWYVLPLIPAVCFYIYLSAKDYLGNNNHHLINLGLAIIIGSRPPLAGASNKIAIFYGIFFTALIFYILYWLRISNIELKLRKGFPSIDSHKLIFVGAIIFSLFSFYIRFPQIVPYHWHIKEVATYYSELPGKKCLWIYDIPSESAIFYSNTGEIYSYNEDSVPLGHCSNFLMTTARFAKLDLEYRAGNMRLYKF